MMQQRHFTSGSRQAPDPFDQFLEEHFFYRKHTARDASCLFRVISEQMYDTQLHHLVIREKCVMYMRKHRMVFEDLVDQDFDIYLDDMSKPKTYGTLIELQAAGYLFERNVFLFEPFNLGNYFNNYRSYYKDVFRVFYTPERHFDSVFTAEYIEEAAICQSICYEILYKDVFKLPDVSFAVEQMLHGSSFDNMEYRTDVNEEGYATRLYLNDGRDFDLDLPNNTNCILENYKLCHFHYPNFPRFSDDLHRELMGPQTDENEKNIFLIQRTAESFLPNKHNSCVRQLLQEGITPFPYKVAKALDPNMYRNIEFDSWNEMRKEVKLQNWYNGDTNFKLILYHRKRVRKIFQVGAKCHVKLRKSEQDLYTCHIQEIGLDRGQCIVFVEQLGEKHLVPYENLTPLPADQFKPWTMPYRFQRHLQNFSSVRFTRQYNYNYKFKLNSTSEQHHLNHQFCGSVGDSDSCSNGEYIDDDDPKRHQQHFFNQKCAAASYYKLKRYTHLENFRAHTVEFCTMPLTVEHNGDGDFCDPAKIQQHGSANENDGPHETPISTDNGSNSNLDKPDATTAIIPSEDHLCTPMLGLGITHGVGDVYEMETYNPGTAIYVPEVQSFCHMYPYSNGIGMPEEYFGYYGYDAGMGASPVYMSSINGACYYLCSNGPAPPGSFSPYMTGAPTFAVQAPPPNISLYANPNSYVPTGAAIGCSVNANATALTGSNQNTVHNSPSPRPSQGSTAAEGGVGGNQTISNTPLTGRINYDAKKSLKANGSDLPNDILTLRFFYNLGCDYFQQKQSKRQEVGEVKEGKTPLDGTAQLATEEQAIRVDENGNQVGVTAKSDANNNAIMPETADNLEKKPAAPQSLGNKKTSASSNSSSANGNKTNQRRYNSRYFSNGKMQHHQHQQHRNHHGNSNSNAHVPYNGSSQHHHNHQQMRHQNNGNSGHYKNNNYGSHNHASSTQNSGRSAQHHPQRSDTSLQQPVQPNHSNQQQFLGSHHAAMMAEQVVQTSPVCGFNDPQGGSYRNENIHCNTPTSHAFSGTGNDHSNEGICGGPIGVPMAAAPGGVYVPMHMSVPPTPPYGVYASQPPHHGPGFVTNSGHTNYGSGPMHMPPPDCMENNVNPSEMVTNGMINVGTAMPPPHQCPSYPPPPLPYYLGNGVGVPPPPMNGTGGNLTNGTAGGVHLIAHVAPPTPTNPNMAQQFSAPAPQHPPMGSQGYFCMPTQQPQLLNSPQQTIQQLSPMTNNKRDGVHGGGGVPTDIAEIPLSDVNLNSINTARAGASSVSNSNIINTNNNNSNSNITSNNSGSNNNND